jgi:hypothetical protein
VKDFTNKEVFEFFNKTKKVPTKFFANQTKKKILCSIIFEIIFFGDPKNFGKVFVVLGRQKISNFVLNFFSANQTQKKENFWTEEVKRVRKTGANVGFVQAAVANV